MLRLARLRIECAAMAPMKKVVLVVGALAFVAVLVFVLVERGRAPATALRPASQAPTASAPASAAAPAPPAAPAAAPTQIPPDTTISMAKLSAAGPPDNCADVTFSKGAKLDFEGSKARGFVVLKAPCRETFLHLSALASCTRAVQDDDTKPPAHGVGYYYDPTTLKGDDTYRGQCLGTGGDWKVKPPSDPAYVSARARIPATAPHHDIDSLMELMR